jgi:putative ABC transport system permease protein
MTVAPLRAAARSLWRNPGFTVTALAILSLGVSAVSALFSVVDKVLLDPLPYPDPDRLVQLITTSSVGTQKLPSVPQFLFWQSTTASFEFLAASDVDGPEVNLTQDFLSRPLRTALVSADYFRLFGTPMALGRSFSTVEDTPAGPRVAILSNELWRRNFRADSTIIGRIVILDDLPHQIVGVLAPAVHLESNADLWLPLRADPRSVDHIGRLRVIGRLRRSVSLADAAQEIQGSLGGFFKRYPPGTEIEAPHLAGEAFDAISLREAVVGDVRSTFFLLTGAVAFVLAISCINTATLLLARANRRTREIAVVMALGAARAQVLAQLIAESLLLSLAGGLASLLLGHLAIRQLFAAAPADLPRIGSNGTAVSLDWRVVFFTLIISALIAVLCALLPALKLSRTDINSLTKDSAAQSGMLFRGGHWRSVLMIVEMAFSVALLAGAGLMARSFVAKRAIDRGFDERSVFTLDMSLNNPRFAKTAEVAALVRSAERRIADIPGVVAVTAASSLPLLPSAPMPFTIVKNDHFLLGRYDGSASWHAVSPQYFSVFAIRLLRGRMFTADDDENAAPVVILNRAMMRQYWQDEDANPIGEFITIGKGLERGGGDIPRQVIGIVADVRDAGLDREPSLYIPVAQVSDWLNARNQRLQPMAWAVRAAAPDLSAASAFQRELLSLSGGQPQGRLRTMHDSIAASSARIQFYTMLLIAFATVAVFLTAVGLYSLMAYTVQQRRRELAIRMALGAAPGDIQEAVVMQALRLTFAGILTGIPAAMALSRVTISLIFDIKTLDPVVFALVVALLCTISVVAAYVPAVRASRLNPSSALRSET